MKNKIILAIIVLVIIILVAIWYVPRAPNTSADGFLVSIEKSGGSSTYPSIHFIDENGTSYYILLWTAGNITYDYWHTTDSFFEINEKYFYYNSSLSNNSVISEVQNIINKTEFYEHEWEHGLSTGYAIEEIKIIQLSWEDTDLILERSGDIGFRWLKNNYGSDFSPAGNTLIELTMPYHHKSVTAYSSSRPMEFESLQFLVESYFN